jgi:hypothetical protein
MDRQESGRSDEVDLENSFLKHLAKGDWIDQRSLIDIIPLKYDYIES